MPSDSLLKLLRDGLTADQLSSPVAVLGDYGLSVSLVVKMEKHGKDTVDESLKVLEENIYIKYFGEKAQLRLLQSLIRYSKNDQMPPVETVSAKYHPSEDQIRRSCEEIQEGWSKREERTRRIVKPHRASFPTYNSRDLGLE